MSQSVTIAESSHENAIQPLQKLSVIIPCYNGAKTIGAQLEALTRQHYTSPWEVIIADNGSTDETLCVVERYKGKLPGLRVVDAAAVRTQPHAMNVGAQAATGEILLFCDADDEVDEGWLAAMALALHKHDFVACRTDARKLNSPWIAKLGSSQENGLRALEYAPWLRYAGSGTMGVKRSVLLEAGGFDEGMKTYFDNFFCFQLQLAGTELHFVPDAVLHLRHRSTLGALFRQGLGYGEYQPVMYKKLVALGVPKLSRPWRAGIGHWRGLLAALLRARNRTRLARCAFALGWQLGRLKGSIEHHVVFL
jgi:glycosyltransferase involved in cell wall biosynthesis